MKQRSLVKMFFINLVTLGIYRLYWLVTTRNALVRMGYKIPTVWLLFMPFILLVASIALMVAGVISDPDAEMTGLSLVGLILFYVVALAYLPLTLLWFWPYSKAVEGYTREKVSFILAIISFAVIPDGIDILVIQDGYNKMAQNGDMGAAAVAASPASAAPTPPQA